MSDSRRRGTTLPARRHPQPPEPETRLVEITGPPDKHERRTNVDVKVNVNVNVHLVIGAIVMLLIALGLAS